MGQQSTYCKVTGQLHNSYLYDSQIIIRQFKCHQHYLQCMYSTAQLQMITHIGFLLLTLIVYLITSYKLKNIIPKKYQCSVNINYFETTYFHFAAFLVKTISQPYPHLSDTYLKKLKFRRCATDIDNFLNYKPCPDNSKQIKNIIALKQQSQIDLCYVVN